MKWNNYPALTPPDVPQNETFGVQIAKRCYKYNDYRMALRKAMELYISGNSVEKVQCRDSISEKI